MVASVESGTVAIRTSRGMIEVNRKDLVHFPDGILGYENYHDFAIFDLVECRPFKSMLSVEEGGPDFVVVDPQLIFSEYSPFSSIAPVGELGLGMPVELALMSIVTLDEDPRDITVNLRGPVVINIATRRGRQVILEDDTYDTKEPVWDVVQARLAGTGTHMVRETA